jgi:site-specific DNA-methyltransferase (adenine-specific)
VSGSQLYLGDCLEVMKLIPDCSVDMVMCDLPYGTTACKWDSVIPFEPLWEQYRRICKGAVVLTAAQPFTSALVMSNLRQFKYQWVWDKVVGRGHLVAKKRPMCNHEDICVFYSVAPIYNPQMVEKYRELHTLVPDYLFSVASGLAFFLRSRGGFTFDSGR